MKQWQHHEITNNTQTSNKQVTHKQQTNNTQQTNKHKQLNTTQTTNNVNATGVVHAWVGQKRLKCNEK